MSETFILDHLALERSRRLLSSGAEMNKAAGQMSGGRHIASMRGRALTLTRNLSILLRSRSSPWCGRRTLEITENLVE